MAPLRSGDSYTPTYMLTCVQRAQYRYKAIEAIIRQSTRPHMEIPARTKKPDLIKIWREQDRNIAKKLAKHLPDDGASDDDDDDDDDENHVGGEKEEEEEHGMDGVLTPTVKEMKENMDRWGVSYRGCRSKKEVKKKWAVGWKEHNRGDENKENMIAIATGGGSKKRKHDQDDDGDDPKRLRVTRDGPQAKRAGSSIDMAVKERGDIGLGGTNHGAKATSSMSRAEVLQYFSDSLMAHSSSSHVRSSRFDALRDEHRHGHGRIIGVMQGHIIRLPVLKRRKFRVSKS